MTSVVIWRQRELLNVAVEGWIPSLHNGDLWIAADTRITTEDGSGRRSVTTDAALKILPLTLELYQEHEHGGPGIVPRFRGELAYAWAGRMLPAMQTFATASSYLKRIRGPAFTKWPTMEDLADLVNRIGTKYSAETRSTFEALVVGITPTPSGLGEAKAFRLRFDMTTVPRAVEPLNLESPTSFYLLGSNQGEIGERIGQELQNDPEYAPAHAIKEFIREGQAIDIGGYLNLARLRGGAVEIYPEWRDPEEGLPRPYADDQIGRMGEWRVSGIGGR